MTAVVSNAVHSGNAAVVISRQNPQHTRRRSTTSARQKCTQVSAPESVCHNEWPSATAVTADDAAEKIELLHEEVRVRRVWRRFFLKPLRFFLHTLFYLEDFCRLIVILQRQTFTTSKL